jgi:excisionase family DNA binding protein
MSAYAPTLSGAIREQGALESSHGLTRDEVMTAREVADLLKMPVSTIYQLARREELPASRLGRTWRFLRPRLEEAGCRGGRAYPSVGGRKPSSVVWSIGSR